MMPLQLLYLIPPLPMPLPDEMWRSIGTPEGDEMEARLSLLASDYKIPIHFIKKLREDIYELRINCGNNEFRVSYIYDGDTSVVLFNCFRKKVQKTSRQELDNTIRLKKEYYETKGDK